MFSRQLPLAGLVIFCRTLRVQLDAGVSPVKILQQKSQRGSQQMREVAGRLAARLQKGDSFSAAMRDEAGFPPLFKSLVEVGEETGYLPEILESLEQYYELQRQMQRKFRARITGPVLQFFLGVFLIAFVIFILGLLRGFQSPKITLFGLSGTEGALIFLAIVFGSLTAAFAIYKSLSMALRRKAAVDAFFLNVPAIGPCLRALALGRFTLTLHLTLDSSMAVDKALRQSLQATGNGAYEILADQIAGDLRRGDKIVDALKRTRMFPRVFLHAAEIAEESGQLPEVMRRQCVHYQDEAARRLKVLTQLAAWGVWLLYAVFAIVMIFKLASLYMGAIGGG